jgi:HD-GYP domain-containing protein (c-di-GMP phosphodiesterase class II)
MQHRISSNLGQIVLSLSDTLDLASFSLAQHQQRVAMVVLEMGRAAGLPIDRLGNSFIAALLHDVGAFSLEDKIRLREDKAEELDEHCVRGESLLQRVPLFKEAAPIVRFHHRKWRDWGESIENPLVWDSQTLFLSDFIERSIDRNQYILHQHENIIARLKKLAGTSLHPQIIDLFMAISDREEFWLDLVSPKLISLLHNKSPLREVEIHINDIFLISELFQNIIDFKSRFTATHSTGVAACSSMLANIFGMPEEETRLVEIASKLHDLGKLAIPNSILEKPGALSKEEAAIMKSHAYYTYSVIKNIEGLKRIAEWAACHHEKLDGTGYPFRREADRLDNGSRIIMVADIFTALSEDRPYRKKLSQKESVNIFKELSGQQLLDKKLADLVIENYDEIFSYVSEKQAIAREFYEKQFDMI